MLAGIWVGHGKWLAKAEQIYYFIVAALISMTAVANIGLYGHWGFPLDMTPVFYFTSSPSAATASATIGETIGGLAGFLVYADVIFMSLYLISKHLRVDVSSRRVTATVVGTVMTALLFIPIRGGFTVSTMNPGRAYYSNKAVLNHAAVNPAFSLLYSATHQADFGNQFRYLEQEKSDGLFRDRCRSSQPRPTLFLKALRISI